MSFAFLHRETRKLEPQRAMVKNSEVPGDFGGNAHGGTRSHSMQSFCGLSWNWPYGGL